MWVKTEVMEEITSSKDDESTQCIVVEQSTTVVVDASVEDSALTAPAQEVEDVDSLDA